jgi:hypothetical protein
MNKSLPLAAALVLLLSSCAHMYPGKPGDPRPTRVSVNNGRLVVNQEPIYVGTKDATIVWRVPLFSPLRFPRDSAVTFREAPEGEFSCKVADDSKSVACLDRNSKAGRYKYTIRLEGGDGPIEPLDPYVVNG